MLFKAAIALILSIGLCITSGCQKKCMLSMDHAPDLRGFKLGMSLEDVRSRFPSFKAPHQDEFGKAVLSIIPTDSAMPGGAQDNLANITLHPELRGAGKIILTFVDGKVATVKVYYPKDIKWNSVDEFALRTAEALNLPDAWSTTSATPDHRSMSCREPGGIWGFYVYAGVDHERYNDEKLSYVEVVDPQASAQLHEREYEKRSNENKKEEDRRKAFQP